MKEKSILAIIIGVWSYLFGGWDEILTILATFMFLDYLTGVYSGWYLKQLNSKRGFKGVMKKVLYLCVVVLADKVDFLLGANKFLRNIIIYFLIANEGLSVLENLAAVGVKLPNVLFIALEQLQSKSNETKKEKEKENIKEGE